MAFQYMSRTDMPEPGGSMEGGFRMRDLTNGNIFVANVARCVRASS